MKIKFTWPMGIVLALASFMIFILSYAYKATFVQKYAHHLVSEHYYIDELNYQKEMDKLNRAANLKQDVVIERESNGLLIKFPKEFNVSEIKGTINFQRPSNSKLDFKIPIKLTNHKYKIDDEKLVEGIWNVKIDWYIGKQSFLLKQKLRY